MKVGCQQCGASYSVSDDKVEGRKLKLRCKRCGEPMIIDGRPDAAAYDESAGPGIQVVRARPSTALGVDAEPNWYLGIGDQAQGPYTLAEVIAQCGSGNVEPDTFVYRDGLDGWKEARELPELSAAFGGGHAPPPPTAAAAPIDRNVAMGNDPFAEPSPPPPASSPRVSAAEMMTSGMQREGTVQFSLDAIRALSAITAPSLMPAPPVKTGHAADGDSGLIDVRSLSEAASDESSFRPIELTASPIDTMAPLALPAAQPAGGVDFRTKVMASVAAFGVLLATVVAIVAVTRTPAAPVQVAAAAAVPQTALPGASAAMADVQPANEPAEAAQADEPADEAQQAAQDEPSGSAAEAEDEQTETRSAEARSRRRGGGRSARREDRAAPTRAGDKREKAGAIDDLLAKAPEKKSEPEPKPSPSKGGSDIDALLLGALDGKKAAKSEPAKQEPEPDSSLPSTPSREQMLAALGKAKAKTSRCKGPGVATAAITIAGPSGRATSVVVSGVEGAAKACVEKAVRSTPFPKFKKESFAVKFPFQLK